MVQGHHLENGSLGSDDPYHIHGKWSSQAAVVLCLLLSSSTALRLDLWYVELHHVLNSHLEGDPWLSWDSWCSLSPAK